MPQAETQCGSADLHRRGLTPWSPEQHVDEEAVRRRAVERRRRRFHLFVDHWSCAGRPRQQQPPLKPQLAAEAMDVLTIVGLSGMDGADAQGQKTCVCNSHGVTENGGRVGNLVLDPIFNADHDSDLENGSRHHRF